MRIPRSAVIVAAGLMLVGVPARGELDVFMQAVGFALTGSDNAKVRIIDRTNCVFGIGSSDVFRLNNVQVDRLVIQKSFGMFVTIELHGNAPVYETTPGSLFRDAGFSLPADLPHTFSSNEHTLNLVTSEGDRVSRAWQYIYSHGCAGKKSPF